MDSEFPDIWEDVSWNGNGWAVFQLGITYPQRGAARENQNMGSTDIQPYSSLFPFPTWDSWRLSLHLLTGEETEGAPCKEIPPGRFRPREGQGLC